MIITFENWDKIVQGIIAEAGWQDIKCTPDFKYFASKFVQDSPEQVEPYLLTYVFSGDIVYHKEGLNVSGFVGKFSQYYQFVFIDDGYKEGVVIYLYPAANYYGGQHKNIDLIDDMHIDV